MNEILRITDIETIQIKDGYDDIQWWSLAMIRLYEWNGNYTYLDKAIKFYDYVWQNAWDNQTCEGGLWWDRDKTYKNAITNELALTNTAKLYKWTNNNQYIEQFNLIWNWFYKYGNTGIAMINKQWLINDGLNINNTNKQQCVNNNGIEWTYNQGVILGALSQIYLIENQTNMSFVNISWNIIQSVMKYLVTNKDNINILHEQVSDNAVEQSSDAPQFKGIFMRYLMYFYQNVILTDKENKYSDMKSEIVSFVSNQGFFI